MAGRRRLIKILKVGKKGEIYTTSDIRSEVGIKEGGSVIAYVEGDKLVIRPLESLEERVKKSIIKISPDEVERISEEAQREAGIFG